MTHRKRERSRGNHRAPWLGALPILLALLWAEGAQALTVPTFEKAFQPSTIGPGSVSTLRFDITNSDLADPVDSLAFTDNLPAGVTIATPAAAKSSCGGTLTAPEGGGTITFSGGGVGAASACAITVNVTSSTPGTHMNVSGDLTSNADNSGPASADLTVDAGRPGFTKSFSPASVAFGGRSTLTFTIDNSLNGGSATFLTFADTLPPGMVVAVPSNAVTDCDFLSAPVVTAVPGTNFVSLLAGASSGGVAAGNICTVSVDVIGGAVGSLGNTSGDLSATVGSTKSCGMASAVLTVTGFADQLSLQKEFTDDPVAPGGTVTLEFTVTNRSRDDSATNITFSDDLDATLSGLTPTLPPIPDPPCGGGSSLSFSLGVLTLNNGSLPASSSCTFSVSLSVPAGATPGSYGNVAGPVSGDVGGSPEIGNIASDLLFVVSYPVLTKEFIDDPVGAGFPVTLEFTITNPELTSTMSGISFIDELTDATNTDGSPSGGFLPFPVSLAGPVPNPPCGPTSSLSLIGLGTERQGLLLTGGSLATAGALGDSCTFSVTIDIPDGFAPGTYTNTTREITGVLDDFPGTPTVTGPPASDDIVIVAAPRLTKEFTDDPAVPGGTVTLEFILENPNLADTATAIAFSDDLTTVLPGLTASSVDTNTCTSAIVDISTPTLIDVSGGTLAPAASCTISLTLSLPGGAPSGLFTNTTSDVAATVSGLTAAGNPATDDLLVTGLLLSKSFTDDPVIAGDAVTLAFTLDNTTGTADATSIFFTDNLSAVLSGLVVAGAPTPDPPCGASSSLAGTSTLVFSGGSVVAGASCTFSVPLAVPSGTADNQYGNVTSNLTATIGGSGAALPPALDVLTVDSEILALTKEFTDDPVAPGDPVTLQFALTNLSTTETVTAIAFDDNLDATLSGLVATGASTNTCGGMAAGFPAGLFEYAGGSLLPGASCTIVLSVDVPAGPLPGNAFPNTTTAVAGKVGVLDVSGPPASDDLKVETLTLIKSFDGPTTATGTAVLSFTIENLDAANAVFGLAFSDDLNAVIPGLEATSLPSNPCGAGSSLSGTSFLTFSGGSLGPAPGGTCTFNIGVQVPAGVSPGTFPNTSSGLFQNGLLVADPATADLVIEPPPTFSKSFAPASIGTGLLSTLSFSIDNTASTVTATNLDFTDNLPAGVTVANPPSVVNTCGGTVTAAAGTGVITLTGGSVGAGATCLIQANATAGTPGAQVNTTGDLTSSSGNSGAATDTLIVNPQPGFGKSFSPNPIVVGDTSTLTFTIDNSASTVDATGLGFTDNLPAAVVVATPANIVNTCSGGIVTATSGTSTITYSGGTALAGASCTIQVDVTSSTPGSQVNTTGDLTSLLGSSGTATDTLTVNGLPAFTMGFAPDTVLAGETTTLTFVIDNSASTVPASGLDFTHVLPAGLVVASPPNDSTTCGGGVLTAVPGTAAISYSGGSVPALASCTLQVDVDTAVAGVYANTSGDLTSSLGNSGNASASLKVVITAVPTLRGWGVMLLAALLTLIALSHLPRGRRGR